MDNKELIGVGWTFPPKFDKHKRGVVMLQGIEDVESSIYIILHTKLGERIMRDEFGSTIYDLLFEPLTENIKTFMASSLGKALTTNEPRIEIKDITLIQKDPALGRIDISISYTLISTNTANNLVIPFYSPENNNF